MWNGISQPGLDRMDDAPDRIESSSFQIGIVLYVTIYAVVRHGFALHKYLLIKINMNGGLEGEASHRASHHLCEEACDYLRRLLHF